jgi:hypothetical protein
MKWVMKHVYVNMSEMSDPLQRRPWSSLHQIIIQDLPRVSIQLFGCSVYFPFLRNEEVPCLFPSWASWIQITLHFLSLTLLSYLTFRFHVYMILPSMHSFPNYTLCSLPTHALDTYLVSLEHATSHMWVRSASECSNMYFWAGKMFLSRTCVFKPDISILLSYCCQPWIHNPFSCE